MKSTSDRRKIEATLTRYRAFEECILSEVALRSFGTVLDLEFDYVWLSNDPGDFRTADVPLRVVVSLDGVEDVAMRLPLPPGLADGTAVPDWGLAEISMVRIQWPQDDSLAALPRLVASWEGPRQIEATFRAMAVMDRPSESEDR